MNISIKNFGMIQNADIAINDLTVIAGFNNTSKSTIGKIIYSTLDSLDGISDKVVTNKKNRIDHEIMRFFDTLTEESKTYTKYSTRAFNAYPKIHDYIYELLEQNTTDIDISKTQTDILNIFSLEPTIKINKDTSDNTIEAFINRILSIWKVTDNQIKSTIIEHTFEREFHSQINNISNLEQLSEVKIGLGNSNVSFKFHNNSIQDLNDDLIVKRSVIMIDNPFIIDDLDNTPRNVRRRLFNNASDHNTNLQIKLENSNENIVNEAIEEILAEDILTDIYNKINTVIPGMILSVKSGTSYLIDNEYPLSLSNLSTGMKSFAIIKRLLDNGSLTEQSILILDEPEIHLHPEWQLVYAELIVLLQKKLNLKVLITTHSPYFINAIDVYSTLHKSRNTRFYLSENVDNISLFTEVTNDLEKIYSTLYRPLKTLGNLETKIIEEINYEN